MASRGAPTGPPLFYPPAPEVDLEAKLAEAVAAREVAERALHAREIDLEQARAQVVTLSEDISILTTAGAELAAALDERGQENAAISARRAASDAPNMRSAGLELDVGDAALGATTDADLQDLQKQINSLHSELEKSRISNGELKAQLAECTATIEDQQAQVAALQAEQAALSGGNQELGAQLQARQIELEAAQAELAALRADREELAARLTERENAAERLEERLEELLSEVDTATIDAAELEAQVTDRDAGLAQLRSQIETAQAELESAISPTQHDDDETEEDGAKAAADLTTGVATAVTSLQQKSQELDTANATIAGLEERLADLAGSNEELAASVQARDEELTPVARSDAYGQRSDSGCAG